MKELSIEQKAKAYDEAYKKVAVRFGSNVADEIFPKESEDERIMRCIRMCLTDANEQRFIDYSISLKDCLDWLEKQGEKDEEILILKDQIESLHAAIKAVKETHRIELEKQAENSVCKVKIGETYKCIASPRYTCFRMGDIYHVEDNFVAELINTCSECFVLLEKQGEQKPADNKGMNIDEEFINALGTMLNDGLPDRYLVSEKRIKKSAELLFSIARKQLKNEMQGWSEEDERQARQIERIVHDDGCTQKLQKQIADWLKSLRERYTWKPSDEQMDALLYVVRNYTPCVTERIAWESIKTLELMFKDLKKLKG